MYFSSPVNKKTAFTVEKFFLTDCITISYFNYLSYFPITDKKPTGIFYESVLRTGLRPDYR